MSDAGRPAAAIAERLRRIAAATPAAEALVIDGQAVRYAELCAQVDACARALRAGGCGPGDAVAVALGNSLDFVVASVATFAIGGVLVPLNPRFKPEEFEQYLAGSRPRAIFHPPALQALVDGLTPAIPLRAQRCTDLPPSATATLPATIDAQAAAIYMFSSGSTGKSKRITRSQAQLLAEYDALAATLKLGPGDRILCTVPLYHAHGFGNALMAALMTGATLLLPTSEFHPRLTALAFEAQRATLYISVPFMLKMIADTRFATSPSAPALRAVISAGAPVAETVQQRFAQLFGVPVSQLYGSTETGALTVNLAQAAAKPGSVGRPLAGYEVEIRDEDGQPLPAGSAGEVWLRTPAMTAAYDGLPDMTAQCFVDGWFFAGDLGHRDGDGDLYISGRKKLMINVAGYKVDPLEVEEILLQHPKVAEAVVVGVEHAGYGEKIKAVIVARAGESCSSEEILAHAAPRLADYKLPKLVEFRGEIPRSPLGKVLRKYL